MYFSLVVHSPIGWARLQPGARSTTVRNALTVVSNLTHQTTTLEPPNKDSFRSPLKHSLLLKAFLKIVIHIVYSCSRNETLSLNKNDCFCVLKHPSSLLFSEQFVNTKPKFYATQIFSRGSQNIISPRNKSVQSQDAPAAVKLIGAFSVN